MNDNTAATTQVKAMKKRPEATKQQPRDILIQKKNIYLYIKNKKDKNY